MIAEPAHEMRGLSVEQRFVVSQEAVYVGQMTFWLNAVSVRAGDRVTRAHLDLRSAAHRGEKRADARIAQRWLWA